MNLLNSLRKFFLLFICLMFASAANAEWVDISPSLELSKSKTRFDYDKRVVYSTVTITNTSGETIDGAMRLKLIDPSAVVLNHDGFTESAEHYLTLVNTQLLNGESTQLRVEFEASRWSRWRLRYGMAVVKEGFVISTAAGDFYNPPSAERYVTGADVPYVDGSFIVWFAEGTSRERVSEVALSVNATVQGKSGDIDKYLIVVSKPGMGLGDMERIKDELMETTEVEFVYINHLMFGQLEESATVSIEPDDPDQYYFKRSGVDEAWKILEKGGKDVGGDKKTIGIIDTALVTKHEDLDIQWMQDCRDDSHVDIPCKQILDISKKRGVGSESIINGDSAHGTAVVGVIAATHGNKTKDMKNIGISGALKKKRVIFQRGRIGSVISTWDADAGLKMMVKQYDADIVNMSYGNEIEKFNLITNRYTEYCAYLNGHDESGRPNVFGQQPEENGECSGYSAEEASINFYGLIDSPDENEDYDLAKLLDDIWGMDKTDDYPFKLNLYYASENEKYCAYLRGFDEIGNPIIYADLHLPGGMSCLKYDAYGNFGGRFLFNVNEVIKNPDIYTSPYWYPRHVDVEALKVAYDTLSRHLNENRSEARRIYKELDLKNNDVLLVHGAGNDNAHSFANGDACSVSEEDELKDNILCVAALTKPFVENGIMVSRDMLSDFSNYGAVQIATYGVGIKTTTPSGYKRLDGTSLAAPIITGIAGLVWNAYPKLSASQVRDSIILGAISKTDNKSNGSGVNYAQIPIANAAGALRYAARISNPANKLVFGSTTFAEPYDVLVDIPSNNTWIRITPSQFQVEGNWQGLNCKLTRTGWSVAEFGKESCSVDSQEVLAAFSDPNETYQVVVYEDVNGDAHWNKGEGTYCHPGDSMRQSDLTYFDCELNTGSSSGIFDTILAGNEKSAFTSLNAGKDFVVGDNGFITWSNSLLSGDAVSIYVLHDDPIGIGDSGSVDLNVLVDRDWHRFLNSVPNDGYQIFNPDILEGTGDNYKLLIVSDQGDWAVSDGLFTIQPEVVDSGLIAYYEFNNGFVNEVTGNDDSALWQYGSSDIFSNGSLFLQNDRDGDARRYAWLNVDTSAIDVLTVEKRVKIVARGNYSLSGSSFANEPSNQQLWISYNYYHYNSTNQAGQYDNREHFYLTNVYVDENSGERVYPQSSLIDTRFDQWVNEKITVDFVNKRMIYTLTNDDGSNPETLTLENIEFDRDENMLLRLNAWDWANGSEHIVDYLKISTSDSVPGAADSLSDGLVAHYKFDGNANDDTGNNNHGTEYGGVTYVSRVGGQAASFDGIDDYINIGNNFSLYEKSMTISSWVKLSSLPDSYSMIVNDYSAGDGEWGMGMYVGNTGNIRTHVGAGYNNHAMSANSELSLNDAEWHLVTGTYSDNDKKVKIYVDGAFLAENNWVGSSGGFTSIDTLMHDPSVYNWYVGIHSEYFVYPSIGAHYYNGQIDELRIYNRALSEAEIQELFNDGSTTNENEQ